jgi:uncharacterized membrane protein (UPF0127 family)
MSSDFAAEGHRAEWARGFSGRLFFSDLIRFLKPGNGAFFRYFRPAVPGILLSMLVTGGCSGDALETTSLDVSGVELKVESADTPEERNQGLMFRKSLGENEGMIFVFEKESKVSFWMKNTEIPLSVAFIAADGTIRQIEDMEPRSLAPVPSYRNVLYALEVNQGWFERNGISPGDKVDISKLK